MHKLIQSIFVPLDILLLDIAEIGVLQGLLHGYPAGWIELQHLQTQVEAIFVEFFLKNDSGFTPLNLGNEGLKSGRLSELHKKYLCCSIGRGWGCRGIGIF